MFQLIVFVSPAANLYEINPSLFTTRLIGLLSFTHLYASVHNGRSIVGTFTNVLAPLLYSWLHSTVHWSILFLKTFNGYLFRSLFSSLMFLFQLSKALFVLGAYLTPGASKYAPSYIFQHYYIRSERSPGTIMYGFSCIRNDNFRTHFVMKCI